MVHAGTAYGDERDFFEVTAAYQNCPYFMHYGAYLRALPLSDHDLAHALAESSVLFEDLAADKKNVAFLKPEDCSTYVVSVAFVDFMRTRFNPDYLDGPERTESPRHSSLVLEDCVRQTV